MKYTIEQTKEKPFSLPAVGQTWRHGSDKTVYLRIDDWQGKKALETMGADNFYSVCISSGMLVHTPKSSRDIKIVEPSAPLKFVDAS